jgi:beta-glucosidase
MGQDKGYPARGVGMPISVLDPHTPVNARKVSLKKIVLDGAIEGHVLVKNTNNALPLKSPKLLSLYGYSAKAPDQNNPTSGFSSWALGFESGNVNEALAGFMGGLQILSINSSTTLTLPLLSLPTS